MELTYLMTFHSNFGLETAKNGGSSVLKCEAWDFSLFCRSQSFC